MSARGAESGPAAAVLAAGDLRRRDWKRFLRGPDPVLLDELYVPALSEAVRYDRCCAYYSSTVLAAAARGFAKLIERLLALGDAAPRPAVRLIVNEELPAEDVQAMIETGDTSALEEALRRRFKKPRDVLEKQRLAMLGWLVKAGLLEIRVGVMRRGVGIVHAKFGLFADESGAAVVFNGSGNETARALIANYERLEISTSWSDPERFHEYRCEYDALWADTHPDVHTVTLPEALRLKLVKLAPTEPPIDEPSNALARQKAAMIWQFIVEAPFLIGPTGESACDATAMVDLWPHQRRVVEETAAAWPNGRLLCDEVGMGKTIEAVLILRRLLAGRGVKRALLLLPAGLLKQWQAELREKGGLVLPRLEGINTLVWPDDRVKRVEDLAEALREDVLLMSRETARTERNLPIVLAADPWDLVLLDEAHAARRAKQVESEFNAASLLLELLRQLQLRGRARGFVLLSATPMQTHPWEPWDLLSVLGEGGAWLADFSAVRDYYEAVAAMSNGHCDLALAQRAAELMNQDADFPPLPDGTTVHSVESDALARRLTFAPATQREELARWLRQSSPLWRRMHRNTRGTLREYHRMGLLQQPPARRIVEDVQFDFDDVRERQAYEAVTHYIEERFNQLEVEKPGKGFVMTIYRRRASSSPRAIRESLARRRDGLRAVAARHAYEAALRPVDVPELLGDDDVPEGEDRQGISAALPEDPEVARAELHEVERLLEQFTSLGALDSKRDRFFGILRQVTEDGRAALVFTEYADTLEYLREALVDHYGSRLGCYSGEGGRVWDGEQWKPVTKDAITRKLHRGELAVLICTDAASEGLNLQAAGALINYDLPWNPSRVEQRIGRIDRIGQRYSPIWIINLFLGNSVDEQVYRVLRERCQLFEHFVGSMQPVLARARRVLMSGDKTQIEELNAAARELERDTLAAETYVETAAQSAANVRPAVSRSDLAAMMRLLDGSFGPRCRVRDDGQSFELSDVGTATARFTCTIERLEADRDAQPLSPTNPQIRRLAESLVRAGERLPLVTASAQRGAFRATSACWVRDGTVVPVTSLSELCELLGTWNGAYPDPADWRVALADLQREVDGEVRRREATADARERRSLQRQRAAAALRLKRELGRFLVNLAGTAEDLNESFHEQMARDTAGAKRLHRCHQRLGGYPHWTDAELAELEEFEAELTDNQRQARAMGAELEAALADPRWVATG